MYPKPRSKSPIIRIWNQFGPVEQSTRRVDFMWRSPSQCSLIFHRAEHLLAMYMIGRHGEILISLDANQSTYARRR